MRFRRIPRKRISAKRTRLGKLGDWLLALAILGMLLLVTARLEMVSTRKFIMAAKVVDGDSLELGAQRIRLKGIDAPEYDQKCRGEGGINACGKLARKALSNLIGNQTVRCQGWEIDKFGRLLAHCAAGEDSLNSSMVLSGWAVAYGDFEAEEQEARQARRGIWADKFEQPETWRRQKNIGGEARHDLLSSIWAFVRQIVAPQPEDR